MAELERELRAVRIDWPDEPELAAQVRARLAEPRGFAWRRPLVVALAVLVVAIAAAFAVPSARTAILRWLGLQHVRVVRVEQLPPTRKLSTADLGTATSLREARRLLPFEPVRMRERPDSVFVQRALGVARITFVYGEVAKPRLTVSEFQGFGLTKFIQKVAEPGTKVELVKVDGNQGLWLSGKPHAVIYATQTPHFIVPEQPILAGNTLVWERGEGLIIRLEGDLDRGEALRLAKSLR